MTVPTPAGPRPAIFKRFLVTTRTDPLRDLVRPSPASRSWRMGHALLDRRLPTPRPLVVVHRRRFGLSWEAYLLAEKVEGACELHDHLDRLGKLPSRDRRTSFLDCLGRIARLVRDLHRRHVSHRDLKAANILVGPGGAVTLIDLVGVRTLRRLGGPRRVKDLTRLHASFRADPRVSRTDKLRFLATYLDWALVGRDGWKAWWRAVAQATQAKVARNQRRNRPLA
jgi:serine/threonine protein kinase